MRASEVGLREKVFRYRQALLTALLTLSGFVALWRSNYSRYSPDTAEIWREGAFAILATALAIGLAEYGRRGYEELLSTAVETTLNANLGDMRLSNRLLTDLEKLTNARANKLVAKLLEAKLGSAADTTLRESLRSMIDGLSDLQWSTHWAKDVYREYLANVIQNTAQNTRSLCELTANNDHSSPRLIDLVSRGQRTDEILQRLMAKMQPGSKYLVVSDVRSWLDDKLERFFVESCKAAKRGVLIRRIFVIKDDEIRSGELTPDKAFREIRRHLQERSGLLNTGYRLRLYHSTDKLIELSPDKSDVLHHHFGIFVPADDEPCIQVIVEKGNLSVLKLTNLSHGAPIQMHFDAVWDALKTDLTSRALNRAKQRWCRIANEVSTRP